MEADQFKGICYSQGRDGGNVYQGCGNDSRIGARWWREVTGLRDGLPVWCKGKAKPGVQNNPFTAVWEVAPSLKGHCLRRTQGLGP